MILTWWLINQLGFYLDPKEILPSWASLGAVQKGALAVNQKEWAMEREKEKTTLPGDPPG